MSFLTIDFETYYSREFSLSKMTTEEYVRAPQFEIIGVSVKEDGNPALWFSGTHDEIRHWMRQFDWEDSAVLAHNALFDGAILEWVLGFKPKFYYDTLCMARAIHSVEVGGSLANLVKEYSLGEKGTEVIEALDVKRAEFTPEKLERYGAYCRNDVELTYKLFGELASKFPEVEFDLIDMTLKMFFRPQLMVDDALLVERLEEIRAEKQQLLASLMERLKCDDEESVRKRLCSNNQFAEVLREVGVEPPMKTSPANGKPTYAFAKNDEGFLALTEHPDPTVQQLCAVRLGTKSTIEESRIERFIGIGGRNKGWLPVPLKYYGAHTGRWAGVDKVNFQNLPSRDKKKKALKNAVIAPPGYVVINCDSSQIEARVLAWLAGQDDVVQQFRDKEDVYSTFATKVYGYEVSKKTPVERFVGKTCIAEGSLILSERGWVPIEQVRLSDRVWDGEEWVCHSGVVLNGTKETLRLSGLWLTPDHQVWSGTWQRADFLLQDADTLSRALGIAAVNLPSQAMWLVSAECVRSSLSATVDRTSTPSITITSRISNLLAAAYVRLKQVARNATGNMRKLCQTMVTGLAYLTVWPQPLRAVTHRAAGFINITGNEEFSCIVTGATTELNSYAMYRAFPVGITQHTKWTELMLMGRTLRTISDSCRVQTTYETNEKSQNLKPVYDILNCGSRNRFTVLTDDGPLIVHNCVLGLGYGTGAAKLQHTLKTSPPGADLPLDECDRIVKLYRETNYRIKQFWAQCEVALHALMGGVSESYYLDDHDSLKVTKYGIQLPNGLLIRYPGLRISDGKLIYVSRYGIRSIWGGAVTENCIAGGTEVLTQRGWVEIEEIQATDTVHDGVEFVSHGGLVYKSVQACTVVDGVYMTPDHEVLTDAGWQVAAQDPEPYRPEIRLPDCDQSGVQRRQAVALEVSLRLRGRGRPHGEGSEAGGCSSTLRLPDAAASISGKANAWDESASGLRCLAQHVRQVSAAITSGVEELRRTWDHGVRRVAVFFRELLAGHGADLPARTGPRPQGQRRAVLAAELPVGVASSKHHESAFIASYGGYTTSQSSYRDLSLHLVLQDEARMDLGGTGTHPLPAKPVYDILNCGPRHRFVVRGAAGPFIVHNCVQALARIIVGEQMRNVNERYRTALTVHDAGVWVVPEAEADEAVEFIVQTMSTAPTWCHTLPVACEAKSGRSYGEC